MTSKKERRTERLGVAFYPSELEQLRRAAEKEPLPFSDTIREALAEWAKRRLKGKEKRLST